MILDNELLNSENTKNQLSSLVKNKVYFYIFHGSRLWSVYGNAKFILLFRIIVQLI